MKPGRLRLDHGSRGFTLVELLVTAAVLVVISSISFPRVVQFYETQKLRQAAIELQSWLANARSLARRGYGSCAVSSPSAGRMALDTAITSTSSACTSSALGTLDLPALVAIRDFCLSSDGGSASSCTAPAGLVFNNLGVLAGTTTRTLFLAGSATTAQYCVELNLTLIRVGHRNGNSGACRFDRS